MSRCYYDLHVHSCLSPCGDEEMTPNNIVNMALLNGLSLLALTDHNTTKNCPAIMALAAENGLSFVPGMELTTEEEIHMICLFSSLDGAMEFDKYVAGKLPPVLNEEAVFGRQIIMDKNDEIIGTEEKLLINATEISIDRVQELMKDYGGFCFPAHIDRTSYSILSVFGDFPPDYHFRAAEITPKADPSALTASYPALSEARFLINSDAHTLYDFNNSAFLELSRPTLAEMIKVLGNA
ncbi:MAG: hypothetical protein BGN88_13195 [Clostridiales bacterium 43-6]|nr:MAG: hypothetical protein BGN88_13195 [Clostridiales bacterium 43-6]